MSIDPLRITFCARESAAATWLTALREACARSSLDATIAFRDAANAAIDVGAPQADVALVWRPPAAFFAEQRQLRLVFNLGAGVDALLAMPAFPRDVPLLRLEDAGMSEALAEYVLTAVLRVYRGFDRYARQQRAAQWQPLPLRERADFRVGVLGLGVIGGAIARTLAQHGLAVRGFARSAKSIDGVQCFAGSLAATDAQLAAFAQGLDLLVSVLPLTPETRAVLDAALFARLARGAHLVNVGRGAHLVQADLLAALDRGQLSGATLDVFAEEPLPPAHPFWSRPEILITPHVSAITQIGPSVSQIATKLAAWRRGEPVSGQVDPARGY
ncbi:MAG: glyoxylate/hydroxypyruvate reductase A [Burkholderiaceae bacterium]|jgi:glyoxylate/hydroxypyruvate reductase A|nr:glyoxylate/hydroxypyruvate reductase A [Burkholderiaceae bacterium]